MESLNCFMETKTRSISESKPIQVTPKEALDEIERFPSDGDYIGFERNHQVVYFIRRETDLWIVLIPDVKMGDPSKRYLAAYEGSLNTEGVKGVVGFVEGGRHQENGAKPQALPNLSFLFMVHAFLK